MKKYSLKTNGFTLTLILVFAVIIGIAVMALIYKKGRVETGDHNRVSPTPVDSRKQITPAPPADWKSYTDLKYGYTFEYPPDLKLSTDQEGAVSVTFIGPEQIKSGRTQTELFDGYKFSVSDMSSQGKDIYTVTKNLRDGNQVQCGKDSISEPTNLLIDDKDAMFYSGSCMTDFSVYIVENNKTVFGLFEIYVGKDRSSYQKTLAQIVSTFKFTDVGVKPAVTTPIAGSIVKSPLTIKGTVPAGWMFEGVFPIRLLDADKKLIVQGQAKEAVPGSWQSGNTAGFEASLSFTTSAKTGFLVLENDNPSGDPAKTKTFEIPVNF